MHYHYTEELGLPSIPPSRWHGTGLLCTGGLRRVALFDRSSFDAEPGQACLRSTLAKLLFRTSICTH